MSTERAPGDWNATKYDRVADPQTRWGAEVLERLPLAGDETVLDAGCGTGRVTELLLARLPRGRVVALDFSSAMLAQARGRGSGAARAIDGRSAVRTRAGRSSQREGQAGGTAGKVTVTRAPDGARFSATASPPWARARARTIESPRPVPGPLRAGSAR